MQSQDDVGRQILSSLPLQVLLYFNGWFSWCYFIFEAALFVYKKYHFYYPANLIAWEASMLVMMGVMEVSRLFLASKGNKTESMRPMLWATILTTPVIIGYVWFVRLQTYVLRLEIIMASIGLVFVGLEFFLGLLMTYVFMSAYYA
jgi:transmembrane protein 216